MDSVEREKKDYSKPEVVSVRDIEMLAGACDVGGNTGTDKVSFEPGTGACMNVLT